MNIVKHRERLEMLNTKKIKENILAIEYPAIVQNVDKALETMGGIANISKVASSQEKKRLALNFRPENIFSKPIFGDVKSTTGLLLKVRCRKKKSKAPDTKHEPEVEILGSVKSIIKFEGICDYQYLPLAKDAETNETKFIYHDIVPTSLLTSEWLTEDAAYKVPYFLPPSLFTRIDTCQDGLFKKERTNEPGTSKESSVIGLSRHRRFKFASYIPFTLTDPIPDKPQHQALRMLKFNFVSNEQFNLVKDYMEKQPIWLRSALGHETKIPKQKLKVILPSLAYYFTTGPWRLMWVRYGYDPRKDFSSRYYQTLDYRIRANSLKEQITQARKRKAPEEPIEEEAGEAKYPYFDANRLPQARQAFYRYCDVHIPKIQEMLDKIPTPLSGAICNEKTGWLPPNFDDNAREILSHTIMQLMAIEAPDAEAGNLLEKNDPEKMIDDDEDDNDDDDSIIDDNEMEDDFFFQGQGGDE